jgi:hypothetical protein
MVGDELAVDDVGESTLETAQCFLRGLAFESFAFVVAAAGTVQLPDLGHGHHV